MSKNLATALELVNTMIDALEPRLRGALVEQLVDDVARERPGRESRKAFVLDAIVSQALRDAPLPSRVRASPKLARCGASLPESALALACDVIAVAETILSSPELSDDLLQRVCAADRQDHMRVIARRQALSAPLADAIAHLAEAATVAALMRNAGARLSAEGFRAVVARLGKDPAIRALVSQRPDCPAEIASGLAGGREMLTGEALAAKVLDHAAQGELLAAVDLVMRAIGRDREAGHKIVERDDEKALAAICHIAGLEAHVYEALIECWRRAAGKPLHDVHKAPVRFRLMRPAEIDRIVARLPLARARIAAPTPG